MYILIFIYFNLILLFSKQVVIPFKQLFSYQNSKIYNSTLFLEDNLIFTSFTELNIGQIPQKIFSYFSQNITDISFHLDCNNYFFNEYDYFPFNSDSYEIINETNFNQGDKNIKKYLIKDYIELYEDMNLNKKEKFKILYNYDFQENSKEKDKYCFEIGFPINKNLNKIDSSTFIQQLKSNNIIDNYQISLLFNSSKEGLYILGNLPHIVNPVNFKEFQLISTYSIPNNPLYQFQILFDEIFLINNNKIFLSSNKIFFNLDLGLILGTKDYFDEINKIFFNEYYKNKICKSEMIRKNVYDSEYSRIRLKNYEVISCLKNGESDQYYFNVKLFPAIYFFHREMNFTFVFDYKDLFEEKNGIYYFKILNPMNENKEWQFGKLFFEKYTTTFDIDSRKIYFYNKNILFKNIYKNDNKENSKLLIIICILLSFLFIGISFLFGRKIYKQRKLRKNELIDNNYDYTSFLPDGKNIDNNKLIEMNIKK